MFEMPIMTELALFLLVVFIFSLFSRRTEGTVVTPPMLFVLGLIVVENAPQLADKALMGCVLA